MPRRTTPLITNETYHIYNRSIDRIPILVRKRILNRATNLLWYSSISQNNLAYSVFQRQSTDLQLMTAQKLLTKPTHTKILAYCFMPNHYHALITQIGDGGISKHFGDFQNSFSKFFNLKQHRHGPLFESHFKAVHIESNEQLLHVSRYIHLKPFTGQIVKTLNQLEEFPWSSLPQYLHPQLSLRWLNSSKILNNFKTPAHYKNFLYDQAGYQKQLQHIKHLLFR